jgi:transcriptional regulator with XRE-family HTH domain
MDKSMTFALNVKALREDSGLTQAEFGETLGLKGVTISKWERGEIRRPHPPMVDLISSEYSVSADDLLGENGYYAKTRGIKKPQEPKSAATTLPIAGVTHAGDQSPAYEVTGDDATIKRVELLDGVIFLEPDSTNPAHKRRIIDETDPDSPEVRLIGKVVYAITKF